MTPLWNPLSLIHLSLVHIHIHIHIHLLFQFLFGSNWTRLLIDIDTIINVTIACSSMLIFVFLQGFIIPYFRRGSTCRCRTHPRTVDRASYRTGRK